MKNYSRYTATILYDKGLSTVRTATHSVASPLSALRIAARNLISEKHETAEVSIPDTHTYEEIGYWQHEDIKRILA